MDNTPCTCGCPRRAHHRGEDGPVAEGGCDNHPDCAGYDPAEDPPPPAPSDP